MRPLEYEAIRIYRPERSADELEPFWHQTREVIERAFELLEGYRDLESPETLQSCLEESGFESSRDAERVFAEVQKHLQEERAKKTRIGNWSAITWTPSPTIDYSALSNTGEYNQLKRDADLLNRDVQNLTGSRQEFESQVKNFSKPQGLVLAFVTLGYFALSGIVVPLVLLAARPSQHIRLQQWGVVTLFLSGLVMFFVSLIALMRQTSK